MFGDGEEDFDAEAFFGIKEENLESNVLGGIDDDLMMKAIEIMASENQGASANGKPPVGRSATLQAVKPPPSGRKVQNKKTAEILPEI